MANKLISAGLSALIVVVALIVAGSDGAEFSRAQVFKVANKLEAYALGTSGQSSKLTVDELKNAYNEYKSWDPSVVDKIKQTLSLEKLIVDFLLIPMDRYAQLIGESEPDGSMSRQQIHFIKRLEANYKKFRPAYLGQSISNKYISSAKTDTLIKSLYGIQDPKPLTEKLFTDAMAELSAYKAKFQEITEFEDVYANIDEFTLLFNYINRAEVKVLDAIIFPLFKSMSSPRNVMDIKEKFVYEMRIRKLIVKDGTLYRLV